MTLLKNHSRLALALLAGIGIAAIVPDSLRLRGIYGWDAVSLTYIGLALWVLARAPDRDMLQRSAAREDQGKWMILIVMTIASFVCLIAIGTLLSDTKSLPPATAHWHVAAGALTILLSWLMVHTIFAVHYAHHYYGDTNSLPDQYEARGGLQFPGSELPLFSDFIYYSFVIGMTCQVSDVQITERAMRKLSTVHGILSFFFNTIVLALSVNIAASLVS